MRNAMHTHKKNMRAALTHTQTHTHTCKLHCNDSVTHIRLHLCVYEECTSILANCRHPDECFGLLALIRAVQPKSPTGLPNPIPFTNTHWTIQPLDITGLPTPYPHMPPHLKGLSAPLAYHTLLRHHTHAHTSTNSIMHPQRLTCQRNMCFTQMHTYLHIHMYPHIHIAHLCSMLALKHSTNAWTHACADAYTHIHARMHTRTHLTPQAFSSKHTLYGTNRHGNNTGTQNTSTKPSSLKTNARLHGEPRASTVGLVHLIKNTSKANCWRNT